MTDAIRKKHEAFKRRLIAGESKNIRAAHLSLSDVDALFAALDRKQAKINEIREAVDWGFECGQDARKIRERVEQILKGGGDE